MYNFENATSWLEPNGTFHPIREYGSHSNWASHHNKKLEELFASGWMRVTFIGDTIYISNDLSVLPTFKQKKSIIDLSIESKEIKSDGIESDIRFKKAIYENGKGKETTLFSSYDFSESNNHMNFKNWLEQQNPNNNLVRQQMNDFMNQDQKIKNPTQRIPLQKNAWNYIQKNLDDILADKGEKNDGDYPTAPFAAWVIVQHMDAFPQWQKEYLSKLNQVIPNFPKLQFLKDRIAVNQEIIKLWNNNKNQYVDKFGKTLTNPLIDVRDPNKFNDVDIIATSRDEALKNAENAGNTLLLNAVKNSNAQTQPSYKVKS
jgi:hypothetical protein